MQDSNKDTEWNDALRKHGILLARSKTLEIEDPDYYTVEPVDDKAHECNVTLVRFQLHNRIMA